MASIEEFRQERLQKLLQLRELGINPYPATTTRQQTIGDLLDSFEPSEDSVTVVGRIRARRGHGKLRFYDIKDETGQLQLLIRANVLSERNADEGQLGFDDLDLLDLGDFVQITGKPITTKTGEPSLEVQSLRLLTKAIRPLPDEHFGLKDKETRQRKRYLDTNLNQEVHDRYIRRAKFWTATREFLNQHGFVEINIPVLEHTTGGADAKPFVTHMDALDQDFYLRISHELPLKRLIGGGYEKVYDIGPRFRNEHVTEEHLPEHVAMEWYWAYADWRDGMKFAREMFIFVAQKVWGTTEFTKGEHTFNLADEWEEIDYATIIKEKFNVDVYNTNLDEVRETLKNNNIETSKTDNLPRMIDKLWKEIRKTIAGPAWLINTPKYLSPLSKASDTNPDVVERFQPIFAGGEMGNGFSELNDPIDQMERFQEQDQMRQAGDEEAMMIDEDYVEMLEYGMPPTCGWGNSERVFWVLEGVTAREGVPFPQLRSLE